LTDRNQREIEGMRIPIDRAYIQRMFFNFEDVLYWK